MQTARHVIVSLSEAEGLAQGCLVVAATARAVGLSITQAGGRGGCFVDLAETLESRAANLQASPQVSDQEDSGHRSHLRLA
jgi:hypothetical protein